MSQPAPRRQLPEPLSGLPEQPVVELGAGHPWLTLSEVNRLVRQQGLAPALARAWLVDQLLAAIPLDPAEEAQLIDEWLQRQGAGSGAGSGADSSAGSSAERQAWLQRQRLLPADLPALACREARLRLFREQRFAAEVEVQFLRRKPELDQAVYSLLRVADRQLAEELYQRLRDDNADFGALAARYGEGRERHSRGLFGPLPLAAAHPEISGRLRVGQPGQLWPPFAANRHWVLLRLEQQLPARLNSETRDRMLHELFEAWLQQRLQLLLSGEPLPELAPIQPTPALP
jgi:parvulin-like peptidyl-prolyl isomerase